MVDEACRRLATEAEAEDIEVDGRRIQAVLDGADLRHRDVHDGTGDLSFNACRLYKATFANADLAETDFRESVLWAADFRDAGLRRTDFRSAVFRDTVFSGATDVHTARFADSNLGILRRIGFYVPAIDWVSDKTLDKWGAIKHRQVRREANSRDNWRTDALQDIKTIGRNSGVPRYVRERATDLFRAADDDGLPGGRMAFE